MMDEHIPTFLAVTGIEDELIAKQFLEVANNDLELAVTLYMESGGQTNQTQNHSGSNQDDAELAQRLQQHAYQDADDVREADSNVHRHETLVDQFGGTGSPFPFPQLNQFNNRPVDFFGRRQQGIFHQGLDFENRITELDDEDMEDMEDMEDEEDEDFENCQYEDSNVRILDSDGEEIEEMESRGSGRRRRLRQQRESELTSTQRRLANLFRPPFDIISIISLDQAKVEAKNEQKWILINIQDSSEFNCQVINRDLWSNSRIKQLVKDNFIFLQYQQDSFNGETYLNFYGHCEIFPHLAILDPLTGERVYKFKDGEVPDVEIFTEEVDQFLSQFSLNPNSNNPIIQHEIKIDPDSLSEEQQIELAMKQSIMDNQKDKGKSYEEPIDLDSEPEQEKEESNTITTDTNTESVFDSIKPINHEEPSGAEPTTRIQIRFPNGKRLVRKVGLNDTIKSLYEYLKYVLVENGQDYGLNADDKFNLSSSDKAFKFIESLDRTIEEANLKNASILLEKD
ncbi:unnamed protein product [Candida verbasci]|uniref:UBX domain-containing protein n=1 Tax=Candida verbasci TaxID=1227364 RepID=A0A9W4TTF6_9ASCO|nr:unnamed protein product [Candida verbasci]